MQSFHKYILEDIENPFDELSKSIFFDTITYGRKGANLVDYKNNLMPLVRTTTKYNNANQKFLPVHYEIMDKIKNVTKIDNLEFNNALIEIYNYSYRDMKFHSDQALDLEEDSYICLYSCYNYSKSNSSSDSLSLKDNCDNPSTKDLRILRTKNKIIDEGKDIVLDHNSIIIFSTNTNYTNLHKIILESCSNKSDEWLGITFRKSKTFIVFNNELPYFYPKNIPLTLANEDQNKEFYKYRSLENSIAGYIYPEILYTINTGDLKPILLL